MDILQFLEADFEQQVKHFEYQVKPKKWQYLDAWEYLIKEAVNGKDISDKDLLIFALRYKIRQLERFRT
jgi:hypothetical protein